jgi:hypothetical protein
MKFLLNYKSQEMIMDINTDAFKNICATCRHLVVVETGREFEKIIDTDYTTFSCNILGWKKREFYLMAPVPDEIKEEKFFCELWEDWTSAQST